MEDLLLIEVDYIPLMTRADAQSRPWASIYMHENRLIILEATVPKGYPSPALLTQSSAGLAYAFARTH